MEDKFQVAYSKLKPYANVTPVLTSETLNTEINCEVFVKCENFQKVGAFKFRGAFNAISNLTDKQRSKGVVAHSSGNHAQAVALVSQLLGVKATIVMPNNAPEIKVKATRGYGAKVVFSEPDVKSRETECTKLMEEFGYTLIHPYDNENVIIGAGTTALEFLEQVPDLEVIICPVGGGGLISGSAKYSKEVKNIKKFYGAEPANADDAYRSLKSGIRVKDHVPNTIADGLRTVLSDRTFDYIQKFVDDIILVSEDEIMESMKFFWERMKIVVEPSGAVGLAALRKAITDGIIPVGTKVGIIITGGNVNLTDFFSQF